MDDDWTTPKGQEAAELHEVLSPKGFRAFIAAFGGARLYVNRAIKSDGSVRANLAQFSHVLDEKDCKAIAEHFSGDFLNVPCAKNS